MLSLPPTVFSSSTRPGRRSAQKSFRRGTGLIPSFSNFCKRPDGSYFGASSFSMALSTDWTVFRSSTVLYIASLFFFCSEMLESFLAGSRFDSSSHPGSICRTCPLFPPGCAEPAPRGDRRYQSRSKKQNGAEQKIPLEHRRQNQPAAWRWGWKALVQRMLWHRSWGKTQPLTGSLCRSWNRT